MHICTGYFAQQLLVPSGILCTWQDFAAQVEAYLEAFAAAFDLEKYIRFNTPVLSVTPCEGDARIGSEELSQNGHLDGGNARTGSEGWCQNEHPEGGNISESAPDAATNGHSMPNGGETAGVNGTAGSEDLPWPRWQVTTAPNEEQVRHGSSSVSPDTQQLHLCRDVCGPSDVHNYVYYALSLPSSIFVLLQDPCQALLPVPGTSKHH